MLLGVREKVAGELIAREYGLDTDHTLRDLVHAFGDHKGR